MEGFGVLGLRPDWLTQTRRSWVLTSSKEALIEGTQMAFGCGETFNHRGHMRNIYLPLWAVI